jgi:lycopene epsilon-cyclase
MELLATLEVASIHRFFESFFRLPDRYWRGFLASKLSSGNLMVFALLTFVTCSSQTRMELIRHLATNPSGGYMVRTYGNALFGPPRGTETEQAR